MVIFPFTCFKCVDGIAASYLCDALAPAVSINTRINRSTADNLLSVSYVNCDILSNRVSTGAQALWARYVVIVERHKVSSSLRTCIKES